MPKQASSPLPAPTDPPPSGGTLRSLGFAGCVRLPLRFDAPRLAAEIDALPEEGWERGGPGPVVLATVDSNYVIGFQSDTRPCPPIDRPTLTRLPYLRELLRETIPAEATRARIACLYPQSVIPIHKDQQREGTIRLSLQVDAEGAPRFFAGGRWYDMAPGEIWAIDNAGPHGIHNSGQRKRTTIVADYVPSEDLVRLVAAGDHDLGREDGSALDRLLELTRERHRSRRWAYIRYGFVKRWRRYVRQPAPPRVF